MKEWFLRIFIAVVMAAASTGFTIWWQTPPATPSKHVLAIIESLNDLSQWKIYENYCGRKRLDGKLVRIEPGFLYANVYGKMPVHVDWISPDWVLLPVTCSDGYALNAATLRAIKRISENELARIGTEIKRANHDER